MILFMHLSFYKKRYFINSMILLSFIILSIFNVLFIWNKGILNGNDLYFHLDRILELAKNKNIFPRFAIDSFAGNGSAVMTMYPYLFLYPFALMFRICKDVSLVTYTLYIINTVLSFIISYYSSLYVNKKILTSYIFSLSYTLSYEFISLSFWSCDFGMTYAAIFLPLVLFGFINWIKNDKWIMLSVGMSLIIYSNVPIAAFTPICLLIWAVFNYHSLNKIHILNLIKAIFLTIFSTAMFLVPAIKLLILNNIYGGSSTLGEGIGSVSLHQSFKSTLIPTLSFSFNGWFPWELTIYSLFGLIIGLIAFKKLNKILKQSYVLSIIILLLSSNLFPWHHHIFNFVGGMLQSTIRMYLIPQVLLTYILAYYIGNKLLKISSSKVKIFSISLIILCICCIQIGYITIFHSQQHISSMHGTGTFKYSLVKSSSVPHTDYYPGSKKSMKELSRDYGNILTRGKKVRYVYIKSLGDGLFKYQTKNGVNRVSIPFIYYHGVNYKCYLDGKLIKSYPNNNQLLTINHVKSGTHYISVKAPLTKLVILSRILTIVSMPIYLLLWIKHRIIRA